MDAASNAVTGPGGIRVTCFGGLNLGRRNRHSQVALILFPAPHLLNDRLIYAAKTIGWKGPSPRISSSQVI